MMKALQAFRTLVAVVVMIAFAAVPVLAQEAQPAQPKKTAVEGKLNINTATAEQIDLLPGMSPKKAAAVVEYRTKNGKFKTPEDLMKVPGIKQKKLDKIRDYIVFEGESTLKAKKQG
jgi:competence protein ComEA